MVPDSRRLEFIYLGKPCKRCLRPQDNRLQMRSSASAATPSALLSATQASKRGEILVARFTIYGKLHAFNQRKAAPMENRGNPGLIAAYWSYVKRCAALIALLGLVVWLARQFSNSALAVMG